MAMGNVQQGGLGAEKGRGLGFVAMRTLCARQIAARCSFQILMVKTQKRRIRALFDSKPVIGSELQVLPCNQVGRFSVQPGSYGSAGPAL